MVADMLDVEERPDRPSSKTLQSQCPQDASSPSVRSQAVRPRGIQEETYYQEDSPIPCPHCDSRAVYRLHRNSLEKLASAVSGHYPYFCRNCYSKFYRQGKPPLP